MHLSWTVDETQNKPLCPCRLSSSGFDPLLYGDVLKCRVNEEGLIAGYVSLSLTFEERPEEPRRSGNWEESLARPWQPCWKAPCWRGSLGSLCEHFVCSRLCVSQRGGLFWKNTSLFLNYFVPRFPRDSQVGGKQAFSGTPAVPYGSVFV